MAERMYYEPDEVIERYRRFEIEDVGDGFEAFPESEELARKLVEYEGELSSMLEIYRRGVGGRGTKREREKAMKRLKERIDLFWDYMEKEGVKK